MTRRLLILLLLLVPMFAGADTVRVAVASNFAPTLKTLAEAWSSQSGHTVKVSPGSTGKHYAQILNGAPFDAFFAADEVHPMRLEATARAMPGSRFTYAHGRLVLWSPVAGRVDSAGAVLDDPQSIRIAIANPSLAPYGRAAEEVLTRRGVLQRLASSLVRGQNVGQAMQFVVSGNAEMGFVPLSFVQSRSGSSWRVPPRSHSPIVQQAVQLTDNEAAAAFLEFVRGDQARTLIQTAGYGTP